MLPDNTIEENLSISCVSAIIARAGYSPSQPSYDFGIDLEVRKIASTSTGKKVDVGAILSLQLKASINWKIENEFVAIYIWIILSHYII